MPVSFFPHDEDVQLGTIAERLEILMEAAERFKSTVLEMGASPAVVAKDETGAIKRLTPRELKAAYNWQEIARIMREIREMPESNQGAKSSKADRLTRLAEIYEVLRGAKMPKLEAVRIALTNEADTMRGSAAGRR
jgi:hypothetical protein